MRNSICQIHQFSIISQFRSNANYPLNRRMRMKFKIDGFKKKMIIHPLFLYVFRMFNPTKDEELKETFKECCELIKNAHRPSNKNKIQKKNENYPQEQNTCWNVIGNDPNVKSIAQKLPPRILLSEDVIKTTFKMQIFNLIESKHIITHAQNISHLTAFECPPNFLDDEFKKLIPYFTHVNVLKFFKCKHISDQSLSYLAEHWPKEGRKVNEIVLYGCDKVRDDGVKQLLQAFNDIKVLILSGSGFTPKIVNYVGETCLKLKRLFLGITGNLWDKKVVKIENVNDEGIKAISEGCKQLTRLNLNHCINVTDKSIQYLAQNSEYLANLEIFGCEKITIDGLIDGQKIRESRGISSLKSITYHAKSENRYELNSKWNQYNNSRDKSKKTKLYNHPEPEHCRSNISKFSLPTDIVSSYG